MDVKITERGLVCPREMLDIKRTLGCGQLFRYFPAPDSSFTVASADKTCRLYYEGDFTVIETDEPEYFYRYFDFDTDYSQIVEKLSGFDELKECLSCSAGLRILRQEPFETAVSFIISANNNIKRIQGIIERLCARFYTGDEIAPFPAREQFITLTPDDYRAMGCGFRSEYLYDSVPKLNGDYLNNIGALPQAEARKELCKLMGVGPKVAECIMLFAYKMTGSFPVDTWIFKACATSELTTPQSVCEYYSDRYGSLAGYAQQYIFEYMRNVKR